VSIVGLEFSYAQASHAARLRADPGSQSVPALVEEQAGREFELAQGLASNKLEHRRAECDINRRYALGICGNRAVAVTWMILPALVIGLGLCVAVRRSAAHLIIATLCSTILTQWLILSAQAACLTEAQRAHDACVRAAEISFNAEIDRAKAKHDRKVGGQGVH
jgi:hypothetical protein